MAIKLSEKIGEPKWIRMSERIAELMKQKKNLNANVDFYSGIIYSALGIPRSMFTVMFAIARTAGWVAHWQEMVSDPNMRIGRPRQLYTGPAQRYYLPIEKR